jgi:hypothetical protein
VQSELDGTGNYEKIIRGLELEVEQLKQEGPQMDKLCRQKYEDRIQRLEEDNRALTKKIGEVTDLQRGVQGVNKKEVELLNLKI